MSSLSLSQGAARPLWIMINLAGGAVVAQAEAAGLGEGAPTMLASRVGDRARLDGQALALLSGERPHRAAKFWAADAKVGE